MSDENMPPADTTEEVVEQTSSTASAADIVDENAPQAPLEQQKEDEVSEVKWFKFGNLEKALNDPSQSKNFAPDTLEDSKIVLKAIQEKS